MLFLFLIIYDIFFVFRASATNAVQNYTLFLNPTTFPVYFLSIHANFSPSQ